MRFIVYQSHIISTFIDDLKIHVIEWLIKFRLLTCPPSYHLYAETHFRLQRPPTQKKVRRSFIFRQSSLLLEQDRMSVRETIKEIWLGFGFWSTHLKW